MITRAQIAIVVLVVIALSVIAITTSIIGSSINHNKSQVAEVEAM